jgi:hypothetical protein
MDNGVTEFTFLRAGNQLRRSEKLNPNFGFSYLCRRIAFPARRKWVTASPNSPSCAQETSSGVVKSH